MTKCCYPVESWIASALVLIFLSGCSKPESPTPLSPLAPVADATASVPHEQLVPHVGGPPGYVGSQACRECHEEEFSSWHRSYHRTMTQFPSAAGVRANFRNVFLTNENTRFVLTQTNNEFWVRMEKPVERPDGEVGIAALDSRIGLVTGSHHMQVFWVPSGDGNAQIGFPFTWLIPEERWVPRKSTFIRPPDSVHRPEIWNFTCSRCHTTGLEPRIDAARHIAETRVGELGISCEACHGPGEKHREARLAHRQETKVSTETLREEIVHPRKIDPKRAAQICGFCHSMKWFDRAENWRQQGFRFRPGDDLEATTPIIRPSRLEEIPELAAYLRQHPELLEDFFWPDGMIRVSGRDYNGLIESPCYAGGKFSCLSCHALHGENPSGQLASNRAGNLACTQCHSKMADATVLSAHTHHASGSAGSECYNCHMPRTTYGVLKAIRSHQISSPRVADELATGRPNACNLCHLDKSLGWTAEHLTQWFGHGQPALNADHIEVSDAVRLILGGDAGLRALISWHFGWSEARQASGEAWMVPVLAPLLDDSYAAVRCMAERSLRQMSKLVPTTYDFATEPRTRPLLGKEVVALWEKEIADPTQFRAIPSTLVQARGSWTNLSKLLELQNSRAVRLRE